MRNYSLVLKYRTKIENGLFARVIGKISALTVLQYIDFINNIISEELSMH